MLDGVLLVQQIHQIHAAESAEGYQAGKKSCLWTSQCPHYSKDQNQIALLPCNPGAAAVDKWKARTGESGQGKMLL